jgi:hypothetical protein
MKKALLLPYDFSLSVKHRTRETKMPYLSLHRLYPVLLESSVADPESGAFLTPGPGIRDR